MPSSTPGPSAFTGGLSIVMTAMPSLTLLNHCRSLYAKRRGSVLVFQIVTMDFDDLVWRVRGEFLEMPGLTLTFAEAERLWGLEQDICRQVISVLIGSAFPSLHTRWHDCPR